MPDVSRQGRNANTTVIIVHSTQAVSLPYLRAYVHCRVHYLFASKHPQLKIISSAAKEEEQGTEGRRTCKDCFGFY